MTDEIKAGCTVERKEPFLGGQWSRLGGLEMCPYSVRSVNNRGRLILTGIEGTWDPRKFTHECGPGAHR